MKSKSTDTSMGKEMVGHVKLPPESFEFMLRADAGKDGVVPPGSWAKDPSLSYDSILRII